jgi:hypothetical protein
MGEELSARVIPDGEADPGSATLSCPRRRGSINTALAE